MLTHYTQKPARIVPRIAACIIGLFCLEARGAELPRPAGLSAESSQIYLRRIQPFIQKNCLECHDRKSAKAGFIVEDLGTDFLEGKNGDHWREAVDQINLGKMPKKKQIDPKDAFEVVEWVNDELRNAEKRARSTGGRAPMRRLNRTEYANTVCDLLHLDSHFGRSIENELPADGRIDGFDRGGAALLVDVSQLQAYLDTARRVATEALPPAPIPVTKHRFEALKDEWLVRKDKSTMTIREMLNLGDIHLSDIFDKPADLDREIERGPWMNTFNIIRDGGLETSISGRSVGYLEGGKMVRKVVTRDGWYRIKIRAGADVGKGKFATDAVRITADYCRANRDHRARLVFTIDAPLNQPKVYEQTVYLRAGGPDFEQDMSFLWNPYHPWGGYHDADNTIIPDPELRKLYWGCRGSAEGYSRAMEKKESPEAIAAAKKKRDDAFDAMRRFALSFNGPAFHVNAAIDQASLPRLWYEYVEMEGPLSDYPTSAAKELLPTAGAETTDQIRRTFAEFLPRAFRRPVSNAEVEALVKFVQSAQARGKSFTDATRDGLVTVLTSPHFLYLEEPTGSMGTVQPLSDYELANRLAYFLWSTMPDKALLDLAAANKLHEPATLAAQVKRLIADPHSRSFVENFVGQWAHAREFDSAMVDMQQYPTYDDDLREAGLREPYEFFNELLRSNLSAVNILQSDFLVINERLAKHYGIEGVSGEQFRKTPILPSVHRGGILGMSAMLTYLADGSRTQPVKRGAYVLDVLWNRPAPLPPPNVGDLPVVKGKNLTVRQRLEQHRSVPTCNSCHAKIDPLGLALENYDAIGAWRERQNGERRKGGKGDPPIDPSGVMPDGTPYANLDEFKQILVKQKEKFAQGFTEKLLAYALGRPVGATDRELVNQIASEAAKDDYRLQAFLQAIVANREFQSK